MNPLDWHDITKARKVVSSDESLCGYAIAEYRDSIIIIEHGAKFREYIIPKSKVERYDGREVYLNIPHCMLSLFDF